MDAYVKQTNVTELDVDAIQNAANGLLIHGAGVAGAIRKAGEPWVQQESHALVDTFGPVPLGGAIATSAGDMPARYVIHAVTMDKPGGETPWAIAFEATVSTLKIARILRVRTLALVALGTGIGGLSYVDCASAMCQALLSDRASTSQLEQVTFAVFGDEAEQAFAEGARRVLDNRIVVYGA